MRENKFRDWDEKHQPFIVSFTTAMNARLRNMIRFLLLSVLPAASLADTVSAAAAEEFESRESSADLDKC